MNYKFVRKIALAIVMLKLFGLGMLVGVSGAQSAIIEPGIVSVSTIDGGPKLLNPDGAMLHMIDAGEAKSDGEANNIELRVVGEVDGKQIVALFVSGAPDALLNIQSEKLQFSEVSPDWYSAHWLVQQTDNGTRLINRWKPAFAIGREDDGTVTTLSSASDATLWEISSGSFEPEIADAPQIALVSDDLTKAVSIEMKLSKLDVDSKVNLISAEAVETGVYRFFLKQESTLSVMHIQNGQLELSAIDASWWSGQWVAEPVSSEGGRYLLRNRWKPEILLERSDEGALIALAVNPSGKAGPRHFWRILDLSDIAVEKKAIAVAAAQDALERHRAANRSPNILQVAEKNLAVVEKLSRARTVQAAQVQSRRPDVNSQNKEQNAASGAHVIQAAKPKSTVNPGAVVAAKAGVEEQEKNRVTENHPTKAKKKTDTLLDKIHGEFTGNNNFTDSVGPFQNYLKLYAHNLLGLNETVWVLGDAFALGKELKALRTGFDLPVTKEKDWFVRYSGHFVWLNPTPVDGEFQSLAIVEQEHIGEFYHVSQTHGHRNETGIFFNYLNSVQAKLELNTTVPRDLSFSSRDLGAFTYGTLWRENETTKDTGSYRFSVSKGLTILGATREFAVRTEARNSPLVVKGQLDARRYWKKNRWHVAGAAGFQWADRPTEWHKHFGLGGANYAPGFPAAEVAGEIGVGVYLEIGRAFDYQPATKTISKKVTLTPYIRGDAAYINSLFDNLTAPLEYARDGFFLSAKLGVRVETEKMKFDVGYAAPVSGDSRFEDARDGRFSFTAALRW